MFVRSRDLLDNFQPAELNTDTDGAVVASGIATWKQTPNRLLNGYIIHQLTIGKQVAFQLGTVYTCMHGKNNFSG